MSDNLPERLQRLGVVKGARHLKPAPPSPAPPSSREPSTPYYPVPDLSMADDGDAEEGRPLSVLLPGGRIEETAAGGCFVLDKVYPLTHRHGTHQLQELLAFAPNQTAAFCQNPDVADLTFRDFLFIDTETTGLAGAGTMAFMVGVAFFERDAFIVRQYFLRDHGDESAMLILLEELLAQKQGVITFNGRSFDLPLLDTRFLINRMPTALLDLPHLDLLPPARRLWRQRLGSCALSALEPTLLGVQRAGLDVPGWLIPGLYHDYIRTGDARELVRVFYHNQIDMVSMVTLASRVIRQFCQADAVDPAADLYSLGKWQVKLGLIAEAEQSLQWAIAGDLSLSLYHGALAELAYLYKRNGRRRDAIPLWQQIATTSFEDITAHVELAKHYEWQEQDVPTAIQWTQQALTLVNTWPDRIKQNTTVYDELRHRLARLQQKQL